MRTISQHGHIKDASVKRNALATSAHDFFDNVPCMNHPLANEPLFDPRLSCIDGVTIHDSEYMLHLDHYYLPGER